MMTLEQLASAGLNSEDCDSTNGNVFIAGKHSITEADYNNMILGFFPSIPAWTSMQERTFTTDELASSCVENVVRFEFNALTNDNSDIDITIDAFEEDTNPNDPVIGRFSIHLFRGLNALYSPDKYYFCKARTLHEGKVIVTLVVAAAVSGKVVYFGDLTNMYP